MEKKLPVVAFSKGAECEADVGLKTEPIKNDRRFVSKRSAKKLLFIARGRSSAIYCHHNYFFLLAVSGFGFGKVCIEGFSFTSITSISKITFS